MSINSERLKAKLWAATATAGAGASARTRNAGAVECPPRLTGGKSENPKSTGYEKLLQIFNSKNIEEYEFFKHNITDAKGRLIEIPLRRGLKDAALIDQLTFTVHENTLTKLIRYPLVSDNEFIEAYSKILFDIFGFGVSEKLPYKGRFFYNSCYHLGPANVQYGTLHFGGQRNTILIELNGTGCQAAKSGWESRLYEFLKFAVRPHITRIDIAHDFFNGEYTPAQALTDHDHGLFNSNGRKPKSECVGAAWREEDYTGKTFYVGRRGSPKMVRVYEKGRAFGDKNSEWVRFELQLRAHKTYHVPLDALIYPGQYLTGAYPIGEKIFQTPSLRVSATEEAVTLTYEQRLFHAKNQVGRLMNFLLDIGKTPEEICEMLRADDGLYPKGLQPEEYDVSKVQEIYFHEYHKPQFDVYGMIDEIPSLTVNTQTDPPPDGFQNLNVRAIDEEFNQLSLERNQNGL